MKRSDSKDNKGVPPPVVPSVSSRGPSRTYSFTVPTLSRPIVNRPSYSQLRSGLLALVFLVVAVLGGFVGAAVENRGNGSDLIGDSLSNQKKIVTSQSQLISQIAKTVGPSVVSVNVNITSQPSSGFGLFGFSQPGQQQAAGTGIIISDKGLILTNRHVVPEGTTSVSITLSDGTELKDVSVIGRTATTDSLDIAFLKVNDLQGHKLMPATIGDSSLVQVGDNVVAIGNALGQFQNTVTSGIISGYGRSVQAGADNGGGTTTSAATENLDDLFQTDAAINEGNSGGPLVNLNGQVIGINTAIAGGAQNVGFSIPMNDVRGLIEQVLKTGKFTRPYLGVRYIPLTADVANQYNLKVQNGAYVAPSSDPSSPSVISGSPADLAGLQEKDIITALDGAKIDQTHSLTSLLDTHQPGDKVTLTIRRGDNSQQIDVTLGTVPSSNS